MQELDKKKWIKKNSVNSFFGSKQPPSYPSEMLVKILSSSRYSFLSNKFIKKKKICEIGCFAGNNIRFFIETNQDAHGVEINYELIDMCKKNLKRLGYKFNQISLGNNLQIPHKSNFFDALVSINTLHYSAKNEIPSALNEFKRVLKTNGILYLETVNIDDEFVKQSKRKSKFNWLHLGKGFRNKSILSFF
jgi:cyclopropane fatty-acyl-phospholipid synthase-like methyltransferase